MQRFIQQHRLMLQLLVFIFGMNAAVGYGACCVDMGDMPLQASVLEDDMPPCHKQAAKEASSVAPMADFSATDSFESCCAACVTAIPHKQLEASVTRLMAPEYTAPFSFYVFSNIETPYRPPSHYFS